MNVEYSYVEVPDTTQEAMAKEDRYHSVESLETDTGTLTGSDAPAAPKLSAPTLVGQSLSLIAPNLTPRSRGMEISRNTLRNAHSKCCSCVWTSLF